MMNTTGMQIKDMAIKMILAVNDLLTPCGHTLPRSPGTWPSGGTRQLVQYLVMKKR